MSAEAYKRTILTQLHTLLKPMGFRKKGQYFSMDKNDTVLFVQLQSSSKSTKDRLVVTINLGIFSRTVAERLGDTHEPNIVDAHWRERIGRFMPAGTDKWWDIQSQRDADLCAAEITSIVRDKALPQMLSLAATEKLKAYWEQGNSTSLTQHMRQEYLKVL